MIDNRFKEKTYIKKILENGFSKKYLFYEMKLLVKYYKEQGCDEETRKALLYQFCEKHIENFNKVIFYKTINRALNFVKNNEEKLVEIDGISISKSEIDYIDKLDINKNLKKLVFTLLVLTKLYRLYLKEKDGKIKNKEFYFGGQKNYKNLIESSKVVFDRKSGIKNIHDLIRELHNKNIVEITGNGNIKLTFMYEIVDDDDREIFVRHYDTIGYYYDKYHGDNKIKECENCKTLIRVRSNRQKYCHSCWKKREQTIRREINKRYYEKNKSELRQFRNLV